MPESKLEGVGGIDKVENDEGVSYSGVSDPGVVDIVNTDTGYNFGPEGDTSDIASEFSFGSVVKISSAF